MNISTVAKRAKVSTATVSRAINGSARVSPATLERVQRAIAALNFYPDTNARTLGSGRSNLFGLIISDITNPFFPELVKAFEDVAVEHGREVLIANTNYDPVRTELCVRRMLQRRVDGVAIMTSEMDDSFLKHFHQRRIPMVFLDSAVPGLSCVRIDYSAGIDLAVDHLTALGHRRIAFISGPLRLASARVRYQAFMQSASRDRLDADPALIQEANHQVSGGHDAMQRILALKRRPTAVIASNDLSAIGAMGAISEAGLRVPQDISVIGYDDILLSRYTAPPLTTVRLPRADIANGAFRALLKANTEEQPGSKAVALHLILPTLIVRESTGPAAPTPSTRRRTR